MSYEKAVSGHYTHGGLLEAIEASLIKMGKTSETITIPELSAVDEFHIGGRIATDHLLEKLNFSSQDNLLDIGCGLGGACRYIANKHGNNVSGIDLTQEYIDVGNTLSSWVGLENKVDLVQGSALDLPFEDESFSGAIMLHVGMNIEDKNHLFSEVFRVLQPGASFGIYDVMQISNGEIIYPVPWASDPSTSQLASISQYQQALNRAGFSIEKEEHRTDFALEFFKRLGAKAKTTNGPPPLGLHTLMQETTTTKLTNMVSNIKQNLIAPIEMIGRK